MKRFYTSVFALSLLFLSVASGAASKATTFPYPDLPPNDLFSSQNHSYSVFFRGNGEAIVYAKLKITNTDDEPMSDFRFQLPKVAPSEMVMFQQIVPAPCIRYVERPRYPDMEFDRVKNPYIATKECAEYGKPDYNNVYGGNAKYETIEYTRSLNSYRLKLPSAIQPQGEGSIIIAYAAKGYVKKNLGLFKFNFETFKVDKRIQKVQVSVDVDSELYLKGKRSQVNYQSDFSQIADMGMVSAETAFYSKKMDDTVSRIGNTGPLVKTSENLAADESFTVRGEFAFSIWRLYLSRIITVLLLVLALFIGIPRLRRWRSSKTMQMTSENSKKGGNAANTPLDTSSFQIPGIFSSWKTFLSKRPNIALGFLSAVCLVGMMFLGKWIDAHNYWNKLFQALGNYDDIFELLMVLVIILLFFFAGFGPAILSAIKRGWKGFLSVILWEFIGIIIIVAAIIFFVLIFDDTQKNERPYYPYGYDY